MRHIDLLPELQVRLLRHEATCGHTTCSLVALDQRSIRPCYNSNNRCRLLHIVCGIACNKYETWQYNVAFAVMLGGVLATLVEASETSAHRT